MPRPLRIDYPGARHLVLNSGARRDPIFFTDPDRAAFLDLVGECADRFAIRVHAYALLGNEHRLLLDAPHGNVSQAMAWLQASFSRRLAAHSDDVGPVWRGRYRSLLVEDDRAWLHLLAFVHLSPVEAALVPAADAARWTSHRAYLGLDAPPAWLHTDELLGLCGGREALEAYVRAVHDGRVRGPEGFDPTHPWRRPSDPAPSAEPPPNTLRTAIQALRDVAAVTGLKRADVTRSVRGPGGNRARLLALWWLHEGAGLGTNAIARRLGLSPAVVSRGLRRARTDTDPDFLAWRDALRARVPKMSTPGTDAGDRARQSEPLRG